MKIKLTFLNHPLFLMIIGTVGVLVTIIPAKKISLSGIVIILTGIGLILHGILRYIPGKSKVKPSKIDMAYIEWKVLFNMVCDPCREKIIINPDMPEENYCKKCRPLFKKYYRCTK